jgi:hypothetical protein
MVEDQAKLLRRKIEVYREALAKGVHGGLGVVYVVEIAKLELLLKQSERPTEEDTSARSSCGGLRERK